MAKRKSPDSETEAVNAEDSLSAENVTPDASSEADATLETETTEVVEETALAPEDSSSDAASSEDNSELSETAAEPVMDAVQEPAAPEAVAGPQEVRRGPGFFPLALGGLVAGAIGFGGGYLFDLNSGGQVADLAGSVETQSDLVIQLAERTSELEASVANLVPPEVDLSPIEGALGDLGSRLDGLDGALADIDARLAEVEARPVFTGDAGADEAAIAAAIDQLRDDLIAQQTENAILAEDIQAMAEDAAGRIAEAEARAEASASTATAQATLSELRIAIASGSPFAEPLAAVAEAQGLDIPEAIAAVADTGVPTLPEIEAAFPAAARAALPVALRANAGETASDRLGAFLRSQIGGRALEPQEGDAPDAILSRVSANVSAGDLTTALEEVATLPDPAVEVMNDWIALAATRISALEAIDGLSSALGNE